MTTMSVVDVESIVGEMPAQVCEWPDAPCDHEASWLVRAHVSDHANGTCCVTTLTMCDTHTVVATRIIQSLTGEVSICPWCYTDVVAVFDGHRL